MRIEYVEGDLIASGEEVVIHGCNAKGAFDKGFAGVVKKNHPKAYEAYMRQHRETGLVLGSVVWSYDNGKLVGNAITQPTYGKTGQHVSYEALASVMKAVDQAAEHGVPGTPFRNGFSRVSMPLIGSVLGGGDWDVIERIIEENLVHASPSVYVLPGNKPNVAQLTARR